MNAQNDAQYLPEYRCVAELLPHTEWLQVGIDECNLPDW